MKLVKVTVDEFFEIPVAAREELVQELAHGLETLIQDYTSFAASCGTKQSFIPNLPPLTRCNQDSGFISLWKKAQYLIGLSHPKSKRKPPPSESQHPRPSTSRPSHRLYIRLNSLNYLHSFLHSIDKSLSFFSPSRFKLARSFLHSSILYLSQLAAFRLIFLDSHHSFYQRLYSPSVSSSRIRPTLRLLKQNLNFILSILTDRVQILAARDLMKASLQAFLMVLLAGGTFRAFSLADSSIIADDLEGLRRLFCTSGEGLVQEELVERELETAEGIVGLMALPTEKLVDEFTKAACEASGIGAHMVPMPPTTGKWNKSDPNTILRVICHRDDDVANRFLKRTFQMAKRK